MAGKTILRMENITKKFGENVVLNNVNFELREGEVNILCGENGAGKSTLMKILTGIYTKTSGNVYLDDKEIDFHNTIEANEAGVQIVHQELALSNVNSVMDNIFLAREKKKGLVLDKKSMIDECNKLFERLHVEINPKEMVGNLSAAHQQMVQIARSLSMNAKVLIMDEPVSSLTEDESEVLFDIIRQLRDQGVGIIYIDHRMDNFYKIGDRVTVLRDGEYIGTADLATTERSDIIKMMVGREMKDLYPKYNVVQDEVVLDVKDMCTHKVSNVSFQVHKGEIFGIGGLEGSGRTETIRAIYGLDRIEKGGFTLNGQHARITGPVKAIKNHIAYVPEDRKREGLVLERPISANITLATLKKYVKGIFVKKGLEKKAVEQQVNELKIKLHNAEYNVSTLSGGNQQKVVLGKWMLLDQIDLLILDEPTRGIDIGAKLEIYKLINNLANQGIAIILITSELTELLSLADRIMVMRDLEMSGILERKDFSQENVMHMCT